MRESNVLASLLTRKYNVTLPYWQMGSLSRILKVCKEWNLDYEQIIDSMPLDIKQPFFYFRKVVEAKVEDERGHRVGRVVKQREKQKITYYNEEDL